jgi:hypothetical protein
MSIRENGDSGQTLANFTDPQAAPFLERIVYKLVKNLADSATVKPAMPSLPVLG